MIEIEVPQAFPLNSVLHLAKQEAGTAKTLATFVFNGVEVIVAGDSDVSLLRSYWSLAWSKYVKSPVGPYPDRTKIDPNQLEQADNNAQRYDKFRSETKSEWKPTEEPVGFDPNCFEYADNSDGKRFWCNDKARLILPDELFRRHIFTMFLKGQTGWSYCESSDMYKEPNGIVWGFIRSRMDYTVFLSERYLCPKTIARLSGIGNPNFRTDERWITITDERCFDTNDGHSWHLLKKIGQWINLKTGGLMPESVMTVIRGQAWGFGATKMYGSSGAGKSYTGYASFEPKFDPEAFQAAMAAYSHEIRSIPLPNGMKFFNFNDQIPTMSEEHQRRVAKAIEDAILKDPRFKNEKDQG